ncbi:MAG: hypothetical protein R3F04_01125 [Lysobacteraceae bacterium]
MSRIQISERRLPNSLELVLQALAPFLKALKALAVESTYNWYYSWSMACWISAWMFVW